MRLRAHHAGAFATGRLTLRLLVGLWVGTLALGNGVASAQEAGALFVLVSEESPLERGNIDDLLDVPLVWLETDRITRIAEEVRQELIDVESMSEADVRANAARIDERAKAASIAREPAMREAYRDAAAAGEISVRFGVRTLPAVIEITRDGYFRSVEGVTSLLRGIEQLEALPYRHESDRLPRGALDPAEPFRGAESPFRKVRLGGDERLRTSRGVREADVRAAPEDERGRADDLRREAACAAFDPSGLLDLGDGILRLAEPGGGYCGTGSGDRTRYSVLDAIIDASSPVSFDCMDLRVSGVCLYFIVRIYCGITGCSVEAGPEASIELSHFNPDLLVGVSKRLGASPIAESELLFGGVQNTLSGPIMQAVTNRPLPPGYNDPELWAGAGSESKTVDIKSTMKYHEVDSVGHPGHIFEYLDASGGNPIAGIAEKLAAMPDNVVGGLGRSVDQIAGSTTSTNAEDTYDHADDISELPGWEAHPPDSLISIAERRFPGADLLGAAERIIEIGPELQELYGTWQDLAEADLTEIVGALEPGGVLDELVPEDFQEAMDVFTALSEIPDTLGVAGLGTGGTDLFSFCPSDADVLAPYHLSGLDIPQWRFNIPEIVYPETYAFPLPGSELFVGITDGVTAGETVDAEGNRWPISGVVATFAELFGAWGSVYPRQGFSTQPDEMKAAAVAAFRSNHVVTRAGQSHIYQYLEPRNTRYLDVEHPGPLLPNDPDTGKWQLVAPEVEDRCYLFGEEDSMLDPWTRDRQSDDRMYGWTLWRKYTCCPEPRKNGAVAMTVTNLGTIPLDIELM